MLWPTDYNPFTFLSRNHQHFVLTGYIAPDFVIASPKNPHQRV